MEMPSNDEILQIFAQEPTRAFKAKDVAKALGLDTDDRSDLRQQLRLLAEEGKLMAYPNRRFGYMESNVVEGRAERTVNGYGWFIPTDLKKPKAFLPPQEMLSLGHGDTVRCRLEDAPKGPVAHVVAIIARGRTNILGTLHLKKRAAYVEPNSNVLDSMVFLDDESIAILRSTTGPANFHDGDTVEVALTSYPSNTSAAVGTLIRSLGPADQMATLIEQILLENHIDRPFPPAVHAETGKLAENPRESEWQDRFDARDLPLCTIDGETAKDFDDAVCAELNPDGKHIDVTVAIADVAHYVVEGTALDDEGRRRGTSVYYPGTCIPMLPEPISNGLCSLKPNVPRLCMVVQFQVTPRGKVRRPRFYNGVMHSRARLTYTEVQRYFDGKLGPDAPLMTDKDLAHSMNALRQAASRLREERRRRGAIDFDAVETVFALNDKGEPTAIHPLERNDAHRLIEDLMIAANETVATFFSEHDWPCIYRIHEEPNEEKLGKFWEFLKRFLPISKLDDIRQKGLDAGVDINFTTKQPNVESLSFILEAIGNHPAKPVLDMLLLRAMMQARYSADNVGHYGLSSEAYLHFTSPIRRYPDLMVHRLLKQRIAQGRKRLGLPDAEELTKRLEKVAEQSSACEQNATQAERAIDALFSAWFMREKVGETYDGKIVSITEFGCFVRLNDFHVDGLIHISEIGTDYYAFDPVRMTLTGDMSRQLFSVGDAVKVQVTRVDMIKRQVSFKLVEKVRLPTDKSSVGESPVGGMGKVGKAGKAGKANKTDNTHEHTRRDGRDEKPQKKFADRLVDKAVQRRKKNKD